MKMKLLTKMNSFKYLEKGFGAQSFMYNERYL